MKKIMVALMLAALVACSSGGGHHHNPPPSGGGGGTTASSWSIGPVIKGKNYSQGMPSYPTMQSGVVWYFDFPNSGGVDAVINKSPQSLVGAKAITLHYAVTGGGFLATGESNVPGRVGVMIQRNGDDWSGKGKYQQYRLYGQSRPLLVAGDDLVLTIPLTAGNMTDVMGKVASQANIDAVTSDLDNYSVVFGGSFASHGVYATQPSRFQLVSLEIER